MGRIVPRDRLRPHVQVGDQQLAGCTMVRVLIGMSGDQPIALGFRPCRIRQVSPQPDMTLALDCTSRIELMLNCRLL